MDLDQKNLIFGQKLTNSPRMNALDVSREKITAL